MDHNFPGHDASESDGPLESHGQHPNHGEHWLRRNRPWADQAFAHTAFGEPNILRTRWNAASDQNVHTTTSNAIVSGGAPFENTFYDSAVSDNTTYGHPAFYYTVFGNIAFNSDAFGNALLRRIPFGHGVYGDIGLGDAASVETDDSESTPRPIPGHLHQYAEERDRGRNFEDDELYFPGPYTDPHVDPVQGQWLPRNIPPQPAPPQPIQPQYPWPQYAQSQFFHTGYIQPEPFPPYHPYLQPHRPQLDALAPPFIPGTLSPIVEVPSPYRSPALESNTGGPSHVQQVPTRGTTSSATKATQSGDTNPPFFSPPVPSHLLPHVQAAARHE